MVTNGNLCVRRLIWTIPIWIPWKHFRAQLSLGAKLRFSLKKFWAAEVPEAHQCRWSWVLSGPWVLWPACNNIVVHCSTKCSLLNSLCEKGCSSPKEKLFVTGTWEVGFLKISVNDWTGQTNCVRMRHLQKDGGEGSGIQVFYLAISVLSKLNSWSKEGFKEGQNNEIQLPTITGKLLEKAPCCKICVSLFLIRLGFMRSLSTCTSSTSTQMPRPLVIL